MKAVYKVTKLDGSIFWTYGRPDNRIPWKLVGHVDGTAYIPQPRCHEREHPHGKPGTYQTWLSVIK